MQSINLSSPDFYQLNYPAKLYSGGGFIAMYLLRKDQSKEIEQKQIKIIWI